MSKRGASKFADPNRPPAIQSRLYAIPGTSGSSRYKPWPEVERTMDAFRAIIDAPDEMKGLDYEFNTETLIPHTIGVATRDRVACVGYSEACGAGIQAHLDRGGVWSAYAGVHADAPVHRISTGHPIDINQWSDPMLSHFLNNQDLCKMDAKAPDVDGSMGYMGLGTAMNMVLDVPLHKECRGRACEGPCPTHDLQGYCLRGDTSVILENGKTERIAKLVSSRYSGKVLCVDKEGRIRASSVTGWYKNLRNDRKLVAVRYEYGDEGNHGYYRAVVTEDHAFLTKQGYVAVNQLASTDVIATGTPTMSAVQLGALAGMRLGDSTENGNCTFVIANLERVADYVELKANLLGNFKYSLGYSKTNDGRLRTASFNIGPFWRWLCKTQTNKVDFAVKHLSLQGLAIWYMDDGSYSGNMSISCSSLSDSEVNDLVTLLSTRFNLTANISKATVIKEGQNYPRRSLWFTARESRKLAQMIGAFVPSTLRYKLPYKSPPFNEEHYALPDASETFWSRPIIEDAIPRTPGGVTAKEQYVYCLDVAEVHNFITEGGVVHNCGIDAWGGLEVDIANRELMQSNGIPYSLYRDLHDLSEFTFLMEHQGIKVNRRRTPDGTPEVGSVAWLESGIQARKDALFKFTGEGKKRVYEQFNPQAPAQAIAWFAERGVHLPKGDKKTIRKTLEQMAKKEGFVNWKEIETAAPADVSEVLETVFRWDQWKGSGKGTKAWFRDERIDANDLLHPRFIMTGSSMGRLSSAGPNFQNIPKVGWGAQVKMAIEPFSQDYDIADVDSAQLELRMCLYLAGVDVSKQIGKQDAFYWLVDNSDGAFLRAAENLYPDAYAKDPRKGGRQVAKTLVHGSNYLESMVILKPEDLDSWETKQLIEAGALRVYMKKYNSRLKRDWEYGGGIVGFTGINMAERLFGDGKNIAFRKRALDLLEDLYFEKFWVLREWHMRICEESERDGFVRFGAGRMLKLGLDPHKNAKLTAAAKGQGGGADFVQGVMCKLWKEHRSAFERRDYTILLQCHDSLVPEIPKSWSDERLIDFLQPMFEESDRFPGLAIPGEIKRGANYGSLKTIYNYN